ncbi:hypothetical protein PanWU01x14_069760, partial [Parasponia andersonii]
MNPKEQCNAITIRSGKQVEQPSEPISTTPLPSLLSPSLSTRGHYQEQQSRPQGQSEIRQVELTKPKSKFSQTTHRHMSFQFHILR